MKNALIIEDSDFMRRKLKEILESIDKTVIAESDNAKEGIEFYKKYKPDFVVLDINMPELSGKDALIRIIDYDPNAVVIMCSTLGSDKVIEECIKAGAKYYILKPYIRADVEKIIKEVTTDN